jgi:TolB protein
LVVRTQLPGADFTASLTPGWLADDEQGNAGVSPTATSIAQIQSAATPSTKPAASLRDTLPALNSSEAQTAVRDQAANATPKQQVVQSTPSEVSATNSSEAKNGVAVPTGTIAFSLFNPAPDRQVYEIHLIRPDGTDHRLFPLDGVSEPALRSTENGFDLAFRAWAEPTAPRSLLAGDLEGEVLNRVGGYWEDAQPDWSPVEKRLIFASQREVDRRWRLYTSWGDGLAEKELRREGKAPSFAPDGQRFVFEGCDRTGNRCGLWIGNLEDSEYNSQLFLKNPLARSPDWAPADERIAFMANLDDNWDLYLADDGKGDPRRLTTDSAIDGLPAWSPDGQWLAFLSDRGGNWGIWILHLQSGQTRQVYAFEGGTFTPPAREPYDQRSWQDEQISWSR